MKDNSKQGKIVDTEISIHPSMEDRISKFQKECLVEEAEALPPIKEGEVDVNTDFIFDLGDKYEVSVFIRNGLPKPVNLEKIPFKVVNKKEEVLGSKIFDLREMGQIPPRTVRPWKVYFDKEDIKLGENDLKDLRIIFDTRLKAERTINVTFENLPLGIKGEHRRKYEKFLQSLPLLRLGQVSMTAYKVEKTKDDGIAVEVVIRNGRANGIDVERIPLSIYDSKENLVASGIFYLKDVKVSPFKARIYSFTFSKDELIREDIRLNEWRVDFRLNKNISAGDEVGHEK
ncbi:SLAP domain-containing protein [Clostridium brassicae]|uniref:SLAP domain-containing protein n=1 Tax=Clostridium brassicae TaxID=2999072 RepID=A0ABT4DAM8_9CLOT|nr:SLAP domain-containing protein [Clostridium brassicae]MCY6959368.1 SLAP domain-containing protein [Clostridium brassicae]